MSAFSKSKPAPKELREWVASNPEALSWEALLGTVKDSLRARMHHDQRGLCCYCYVRVAGAAEDHIEHVEPQSDKNRFDWDNLALSCEGGNRTGRPPHCDHSKRDQRLTVVHPYRSPVTRHADLVFEGRLKTTDAARHDIDDVLQLNRYHLIAARRSAIEASVRDLSGPIGRRQHWRSRDLESALRDLRESTSFAPLVRGWLERQIRARS